MAPSVVAVPGENIQFVLCGRGMTMSMNLNGFEALEDRVLLAGNVTASINTLTGAWTITGDGAANGVSIVDTDGDANGLYEIETDATTNLTLVVDGVATNLGLGANSGNIPVAPTSVVINLGAGNDEFFLVDSEISGYFDNGALNLTINAGDGNDVVDIGGAGDINLGNVSIDGGKGNDELYVYTLNAIALSVAGGAGDDYFDIYDFEADRVNASGGAGNDTIYLGDFDADIVAVSGGAGNDYIVIYDADMVGLYVDGGAGFDIVVIDNIRVDRTSIKMDGNNDLVEIFDSSFYDSFDLKGGAKADRVTIGNSEFLGVNTLNGGGGNNVLVAFNDNTWSAGTTIKGF